MTARDNTARLSGEPGQFFTGPCCACGNWFERMRSIGMLPFKGPTPGEGWGCFTCGLPNDGAMVIVCDVCYEEEIVASWACAEGLESTKRVTVASLTEPFDHDRNKHPELGQGFYGGEFEIRNRPEWSDRLEKQDDLADFFPEAAQGARLIKDQLDAGGMLTAQIADGMEFDDLVMLRLVVLFGGLPIAEFGLPAPSLPEGWEVGEELVVDLTIRKCRQCGCTRTKPCQITRLQDLAKLTTGCEWVEKDLCSSCAPRILDAHGRVTL